jgi:hypothetical protein
MNNSRIYRGFMTNLLFTSENWESDIRDVAIEMSDADPSGYKAVFYLSDASPKNPITFTVGASTLAQRARSLALAGYKAPMTKKAIALLETRIGVSCPA